mmetsp:Transcript_17468/g.51355  ORF Transcript_17468/g.51355 Transcript_17468/m.51355 type:complete len:306 (+) Transcript_17468:461-1378(+)
MDILVAAPRVRPHAAPLHHAPVARLRTGRQLEGRLPLKRRDDHPPAQHRLGQREAHHDVDVEPIPHEELVVPHPHLDVQVSRPGGARLPLASHAEVHPRVHARGDRHLCRLRPLCRPPRDRLLDSHRDLLEVEHNLRLHVSPAARPALPPALAAEELLEDVVEVDVRVVRPPLEAAAARVEALAKPLPRAAAAAAAAESGVAIRVVGLALLAVAQHLVGLCRGCKLLGRLRVVLVGVRVVLLCLLVVLSLDLARARRLGQTEHVIIVLRPRHCSRVERPRTEQARRAAARQQRSRQERRRTRPSC